MARAHVSDKSKGICFMLYGIGDKPGKGTYQCINCDWTVVLATDEDPLCGCGSCGDGPNVKFRRIRIRYI